MYRIEITPSAARALEDLAKRDLLRIDRQIQALSLQPRPQGVQKLKGMKELYRIRVGDWRVIYQIQDERLVILVVKVAHRKDVYRQLKPM